MTDAVFERHYQELERLCRDGLDEMVEHLSRLLTFWTVSGSTAPEEQRLFRNDLTRAFSFLSGLARDMGFECRNYGSRVLVIEKQGGPGTLGLPLHVDVVPSGEGWHYPAFGGMVENDTIYGRGAQDDKGPIIEMLYALHAVARLGVPFRRTVRLIVASQEETGDWADVDDYLTREPAPDISIVPDAGFPICNGEKGMLDLRLRVRWPAGAADAVSPLRFHGLAGGERSNVVPNRADVVFDVAAGQAKGVSSTLTACLRDFLRAAPGSDAFPVRVDADPETGERRAHVTFMGLGAHASSPEKGRNALVYALRYFATLPELPAAPLKTARFLAELCGDHYGAALGVEAEHDFIGRTTISLGVLNMDAEGATATINVRPTFGQTCEEVVTAARAHVARWAAETGFEAEVETPGRRYEPLFVAPESQPELIGALQQAFTRVTGDEATLSSMGGTTFAKAFPNAVSFGPNYSKYDEGRMHQADECVTFENLLRNTRIYGAAILLLAADMGADPPPDKRAGRGLDL